MEYQVKVEYTGSKKKEDQKWISYIIPGEALEKYSFTALVSDISKRCTSLQYLNTHTMRIRYLDDEGNWINLNGYDDRAFSELWQCAVPVTDRELLKRIKLQAGEIGSPAPVAPSTSPESPIVQDPAAKKQRFETSTARSLNKTFVKTTASVNPSAAKAATCESQSNIEKNTPIQRYLIIAKEKVEKQRSKLHKARKEREDLDKRIEQAKIKSCIVEGQICGNCHLKIGHSVKKCDLGKCTSVLPCGQEKHHPGELNRKRLSQIIDKEEKLLMELELEVHRREKAIECVETSIHKKIEDLLLSQKENYTSKTGSLDWHLLRKHVTLIEKYCKKNLRGKIPGRDAIPGILKCASKECEDVKANIGRVKQSKSKGNPFKKPLEDHGISFPSPSAADECCSPEQACPASTLSPTTVEEEHNQLQIAIRESLYFTQQFEQPTSNTVVCPPTTVNPSFPPGQFIHAQSPIYYQGNAHLTGSYMSEHPQLSQHPSQYSHMAQGQFFSQTQNAETLSFSNNNFISTEYESEAAANALLSLSSNNNLM